MGVIAIHQRTSKASALLGIHRFLLRNLANLDGFCAFYCIWLLECKKDHKSVAFLWLGYWWAFLENLEHLSHNLCYIFGCGFRLWQRCNERFSLMVAQVGNAPILNAKTFFSLSASLLMFFKEIAESEMTLHRIKHHIRFCPISLLMSLLAMIR